MINGIGAASHLSGPSVAPGAGLDGETILLYCATQLNDLNSEIKARMDQQRATRDAKGYLNQVRAVIGRHAEQAETALSAEEKQEICKNYAEAIRALPPGNARDSLMKSFNEFRRTACYNNDHNAEALKMGPEAMDGYLTLNKDGVPDGVAKDVAIEAQGNTNALAKHETEAMIKELGNFADEVGKNAELDMIGLQQLISQRQMAIQTTTNLMAKMNQSLETIVQNYK
jgi:hypothetical protein